MGRIYFLSKILWNLSKVRVTAVLTVEGEVEPAYDVLKSDVLIEFYIFEVDHAEVLEIGFESVVLIVNFDGLYFVFDADVGAG